jgi:hypothetical protein
MSRSYTTDSANVTGHRAESPHYFAWLTVSILNAHTNRDCGLMYI